MQKLLWAELKKTHRSPIIWIAIFATVMAAVIVYIGGADVYEGSRNIDKAGWYMSMTQPMSTFFVLPGVIALLGSYMICREDQEDTLKALLLIPVKESRLVAAKMIVILGLSILLHLLLFCITLLGEVMLHFSALPAGMVLGFFKAYTLDGTGVFFAVSPIIALVSRMKKGYWLGLFFAVIYSFAGLFMSMSNVLKAIYPITAVFTVSGYYDATISQIILSCISLLLCGGFSGLLLMRQKQSEI